MAEKTSSFRNAVLFHHPDAVDTGRERLLGRHAAGEGFLKGFVRHSGAEAFYCQSLSREHFDDFTRRVGALDGRRRPCHWVPLGEMAAAQPATLLLSDPSLAPFAWRRRATGNRGYSICGVNHTIASDGVMDSLGQLLTAPVQPWDALICTSSAVKATIERVLDNWADYLGRRIGGRPKANLQLPVIPLGVDCDAFAENERSRAERGTVRRGLGIAEDDVVVLFVGRLSYHAKAHPTPMYLSLEEAARRCGKRLHLIQAGWFANESIEREFRDGVRAHAPSVNGIFLDGREPDVRFKVWFAADIFASLSDNIQETFGLTPVEAMAAGLPVVVSDWDGYRDTVRPGIDGFTIPSWMPLPQSGGDLALPPEVSISAPDRDAAYNQYCGAVSQSTAVDIGAAADAFATLASDRELRLKMGEAGRQRARQAFDWRVVVDAYQMLWRDLANIRNREKEIAPVVKGRPALPLRDDPFTVFADYPTGIIDGGTVVSLAPGMETATEVGADGAAQEGGGGRGGRLKALQGQSMNVFAAAQLLGEEDRDTVLKKLEDEGPADVHALSEPLAEERRYLLPRTLAWLAKMGIVRLAAAPGDASRAGDGRALAPERTAAGTLLERAAAARARGAMGAAARYFKRALEDQPDDPAANTQYGELLAYGGKLDDAKACFETALKTKPGHLPAQRNLGKVLFLGGDTRAAQSALERAGALDPGDAETKQLLGVCFRHTGDRAAAVSCLEASLELDDRRADVFQHLGLVKKSLGRRDEAMDAFESALALDAGNVAAGAQLLSLKAEERGRRNVSGGGTAKRVGLYVHAKFHFPLLKPLFDAFCENHWPLLSTDGLDLAEFGPDATLVCDAEARGLEDLAAKTTTVNVRHSLAGRNFARRAARHADFTCVSSRMARDEIVATGVLPEDRIWVTGFAPNDPLFRGVALALPFELPKDRKTVLYAPTHNARFSSAAMLGERVATLIGGARDDISIVIKPHPRTCESRPGWMNAWGALAARDPNIHVVRDPAADIAPYLMAADVLVSDASGVIFQYLALDRPIVLVTSPDRTRDRERYDPDAIEWRWRDIGEEVTEVADLAAAVARALADPDAGGEKRTRYRELLFDDLTDGRSGERIVEKIAQL